ncbi:MAG: NYN domain-containing protein [Phascolarctobacterium sp.]|uniref:NYN domain-containing protein n=1 Tax=Phascolarctobacterium sp. TaxID=2049039 RepID=UPI0026DBBD04|nr:NYN domain-containing protein [Phascolarctobacterium sp.]MDO4920964.1 NYN domain-containing protein [Phascolarctobacterium sp.]
MKVAIFVDGGFYRRRSQSVLGDITAEERAKELETYCHRHLHKSKGKDNCREVELYRIFYYDCPPMDKKIYHPLLKKQVDFSKTELFVWSNTFLDELKKKRKFALRLGKLADAQAHYSLKEKSLRALCNGKIKFEDLTEQDFIINVDQKGVDMKIGIDIASLAYKKQVDQIVLISGDSDFVPAAKLARREGIDFILDPLGAPIKPDLFEHIDGLRSCDKAYVERIQKQQQ